MEKFGSRKRLKTSKDLSQLIKDYYREAYQSKERGIPLAWITSAVPVEIFVAMDVATIFPENNAAACAARQISARFCETTEAKGFSPVLCSYARTNLGSVFEGWDCFSPSLPKPDLLVALYTACITHIKWWETLSGYYGCPLLVMDAAFIPDSDPTPYQKEYFIEQLKELISFIEIHTDKRLDMARLKEVVRLSNLAGELWDKVSSLRKTVPSPIGYTDVFNNMMPSLTLAGTQIAVDHYKKLLAEVEERVEKGISALTEEKYRLIWEGFPLWYNLGLLNYLEDLGAVVVTDLYSENWTGLMDTSLDPLMSLTNRYLPDHTTALSIEAKIDRYKRKIEEYHVDGIIFHFNRSCRWLSLGQLDVIKSLKEEVGIPVMFFESDHNDPRGYSDSEIKLRLDSFINLLEARRNRC